MEKIAILSNSKLNQVNIKNYSFISLREKEILQLILKGKKNKEIAEELFLSIKTIENHRNNILKKTKSKNMILLLNELYKVGFLS
jgi:DNA-binding NarL/FixJ family response regulator